MPQVDSFAKSLPSDNDVLLGHVGDEGVCLKSIGKSGSCLAARGVLVCARDVVRLSHRLSASPVTTLTEGVLLLIWYAPKKSAGQAPRKEDPRLLNESIIIEHIYQQAVLPDTWN